MDYDKKWATKVLFAEFQRYLIVGGIAFVLDFTTLFLLTSIFHIHYLYSAAIGFVLGLTCNYVLSIGWVFSSRNVRNRYVEYGVFALIGVIGLGLNELAIWLLTAGSGFHYTLSKIGATVIVFFWNFSCRKFLLFR